MRYIFILVFLVVSLSQTKARTNVFHDIQNDILNIKTDKAKANLMVLSINSTEVYRLHSYAIFVEFLTTTNQTDFENTIYKLSNNLDNLKNFNDSPEKSIAICDVQLFKACLYYLNKDYMWGIAEYIKAKNEIKRISNKYPEHFATSKYRLIEIFAEYIISENLPFSNKSDIQILRSEYINIVKSSLKTDIPETYKKELRIISAILYRFIENDYSKRLSLIESFGGSWSMSGPVESIIYSQTAAKAYKIELSHKTLLSAVDSGYNNHLNRINLALGNLYLNSFNDSAVFYLNKYIANQTNKKDVTYVQLKLSWYYFIKNELTKSEQLVSKINASEREYTADESQAKYEIRNYKNWDSTLLKARLAFDGGKYNYCINTLLNYKSENMNEPQLLEYNYRLARAYDMIGNNEALLYYNKVIMSEMDSEFYYPAYSAFYAGAFSKNDTTRAKYYYEKCLDLNSPIYEWSIHKKAKQELAGIE